MPGATRTKHKLDKDYFHEIAQKCAYLGVAVSEKDFISHPDTYLSLAASYDKQANEFNLQHKGKLLELQKKFIKDDNLPEFLAFGKAGQALRAEFHQTLLAKQMAQVSFDILKHNFDFSINEINNPNNLQRLNNLAQSIGIDADTLKQDLTQGQTIAEALLLSHYKNDLLKVAALDAKVQLTTQAMADFAQVNRQDLFNDAVLASDTKTQFSRLISQNIVFAPTRVVKEEKEQASPINNQSAVERILSEFSQYHDNQNGKLLLAQDAKALKKKANFVYLDKIIKELNLDQKAAVQFRIQLSQHKGSIQDFLQNYDSAAHTQAQPAINNEKEVLVEPDAQQQKRLVELDKRVQQSLAKKQKEEQKRLALLEKKTLKENAKKQKEEQKQQQLMAKKAQKEAQKQLKAERQKQQMLAKKAQKEALRKQKAERKLQRKLARQNRRRSFWAKLKSFIKKPVQIVLSSTAYIAHSSQQAAAKIRKLLTPAQKKPKMQFYIPQQKKQSFFERIFARKRIKRKQQVVENISLNIENYKEQKKQAKKAKIIEFKQNVREKGKKTLKYAAIGIPFVGLSYMGYKGAQNMGSAFDFRRVSMAWDSFSLPKSVLDKANTYYADVNDFFGIQTQEYDNLPPSLSWMDFTLTQETPINEADYDVQVPLIKNDRLHNVPNADFFNLCFEKTNATYLKNLNYGISKDMYNDFMRENRALANFYNIGSFNKLSTDEARIIAKAQIFDKYGISHIQNPSMASYLYYTLVKNHDKNCSVAMVASAISDFYELKGIQLSSSQQNALQHIANSNTNSVSPNEWRELIAAVNMSTTDQDIENRLFSAIQQSQFRAAVPFNDLFATDDFSQQVAVNASFAYEPTLDIQTPQSEDEMFFADTPFFTEIQKSLQDNVSREDILYAQKEKDLETFAKIYAQCSYDNVIRLSYGDKRKAFADANKALSKQGIFGRIDQRLYCAGMSMASLCQAYDIFKQENPNSQVADAIGDIIDKCRINAHSTTGMRDVFKRYSNHMTYSQNLEGDIKTYMKNNPHAIVQSGFRRNAAGNQHYNGFFPSMNSSSKDAYTYCAYNNNHWGNEKTFSSVLRDRRRAHYGKGGWYVDVTAWIDDLANAKIKEELKQMEIEKQLIKPASLSSISEKYFGSLTDILSQKFSR